MASTEIKFKKVGNDYVCKLNEYSEKTTGTVHLHMTEPNQKLIVGVGAPDMPVMTVKILQAPPDGYGLVFEIDFPEGLNVRLCSTKPVTKGIWIN